MVNDSSEIITLTKAFVKTALEGKDGSHDFAHIERVWNLTKTIGQHTENLTDEDYLVCELAALLHDVDDWKYESDKSHLDEYFKTHKSFLTPQIEERIRFIVKNVSFHTEITFSKEEYAMFLSQEPALAIVQDADRLDAIGAIGIGRTFTYGGYKSRPLYDDASMNQNTDIAEERVSKDNSGTLQHFYDKLFKLKDRIKTVKGKEMAEERHKFMETFVLQFKDEVYGLK